MKQIILIFLLLVSCSEIAKIGFEPKGTWYSHTDVDSLGNFLKEKPLLYYNTLSDSIVTIGWDDDGDGKIIDSPYAWKDEIDEYSISWSITKDTIFDIDGYAILKPITRDSVLVKFYVPNSPDTTEANLDEEIWWEVWSKNPPTYHPDWSDAYLNLYRN